MVRHQFRRRRHKDALVSPEDTLIMIPKYAGLLHSQICHDPMKSFQFLQRERIKMAQLFIGLVCVLDFLDIFGWADYRLAVNDAPDLIQREGICLNGHRGPDRTNAVVPAQMGLRFKRTITADPANLFSNLRNLPQHLDSDRKRRCIAFHIIPSLSYFIICDLKEQINNLHVILYGFLYGRREKWTPGTVPSVHFLPPTSYFLPPTSSLLPQLTRFPILLFVQKHNIIVLAKDNCVVSTYLLCFYPAERRLGS